METIWYHSGDARVCGWYSAAARQPAPVLVVCPGFTGTKYAAFYRPYVARLTAAGYGVLQIDYRGWGDSEGDRGLIVPLRQVEDICNALTYLQTRSDVDPDRLGLLGVSFGAGNVSYAAAVDPRVRCTIAVSPVADGALWLRGMRREYEWQEFLDVLAEDRHQRVLTGRSRRVDPTEDIMIATPERRTTTVKGDIPKGMVPTRTPLCCADAIMDFRPVDLVGRISPRAILWFNVQRDSVVAPENAQALFDAAGEPKRLVTLGGRSHYGAYVEHFETIMTHGLAWLEEYL